MLENEEIDTKDMSDLESEKSAAKRNITRKAELRTQKLNTIKEKEKINEMFNHYFNENENLDENCVLYSEAANSIFAMTDAKHYVPIVTLSAEDNAKLSKLLGEGFKRSIYWNKYKVIPDKTYNANDSIRELLDSSCQGVKILFVLAYDNVNGITADSHRRYFLSRVEIKNYNIEIDGRSFYDQPINDMIK